MTSIIPTVILGTTSFTGADIITCDLVEEFNPLTLTLPINTCDITIFSIAAGFSMINPTGDYKLLQRKAPVMVYENTTIGQVLIGQYFLDTWENPDNNTIKLHCVDIIGLLEMYNYLGGIWTTATYVTTLLRSILDPLGVAYQIDPYFNTFQITGWLPISTVRQAIQQIAFGSNAYVITSRQNGLIKFGRQLASGTVAQGLDSGVFKTGQSRVYQERYRPAVWSGVVPVISIATTDEGDDQVVTLLPFVTGVEITEHNYVAVATTQQLYNGTLAAGLITIYFDAPMHDLAISGTGTISSSGANYAVILSTGGTVTLTGQIYIDTTKLAGLYVGGLDATVTQNIKTITTATMVSDTNGATVLSAVFNYFQQRYHQTVKLFEPISAVGSEVLMATLYGYVLDGIVEKMTVDLAMGFQAETDVTGIILNSPWIVGTSKMGYFTIS